VTDLSMYPIEKIKTRLQISGISGLVGTPLETLKDLFANVWVVLVCSPIYYGMYFAAYEPLKRCLIVRLNSTSSAALISSIAATFVMFITRVPAEVIKTRLMTGADASPMLAVRRLYARAGVSGFYTGYLSLATVEYPFNMLEITLYECIRKAWAANFNAQPGALGTVVIASLADSVSGFLTNPFDVIKVRVMNRAGDSPGKFGAGVRGQVRQLLSEEGLSGFFGGAYVRTAWMTVGGVVYWLVLEESQKVLRRFMCLAPKLA